jgi:predicted KAP-like P-loop ATPase
MFYSDRPIIRPGEDLLGRAPFALRLAKAIDQLAVASDGFVIAIHGPWGSGKTSIVELVARYLRYIEMERASHEPVADDDVAVPKTIVQLDEMSLVFGKIAGRIEALDAGGANLTYWQRVDRIKDFQRWLGNDDEAEIADRYWKLKLEVDENPRTLVVRFSPWLIAGHTELASALLAELARALGDKLGSDVNKAFKLLLIRLAQFAPLAGSAFDWVTSAGVGGIFSNSAKVARNIADQMTDGPTLDELRERLRNALLKLSGQRILLIVDDLDRLTPTEALKMVSVVKSLGDLPNVIYLLSYDEGRLAACIEKKIKVSGRDFLEKIVQYAVALPIVRDDELLTFLNADLARLVGNLGQRDEERLAVAWSRVFRWYFRTPRDIRRFVNGLAIALPALGEHLDPVDIMLLEAVRLSDPTVYNWIRENLDNLTSN